MPRPSLGNVLSEAPPVWYAGVMRRHVATAAVMALAVSTGGTELSVRIGQGGFHDDRASDGRPGGGQICLDLECSDWPLGLSIGDEYYTKSPEPTHPYEIPSILMVYAFHRMPLAESRPTSLDLGGGVGRLRIPQGEKAAAFQIIARIHTRAFWKLGIYAGGKYIYSRAELIDFSEAALLIGISLAPQ